jgi:hypothetical protein
VKKIKKNKSEALVGQAYTFDLNTKAQLRLDLEA